MKKISQIIRHNEKITSVFNKYTVLTVFLAAAFSLGSMAGVNLILWAREDQLLSEHGEIMAETVISEWQKRETISIAQMEEVVSSWGKSKMTAHTPVNRQISMEEAVKAGKVWLTRMDFIGYNWEEEQKGQIYAVHAVLGAQKELKNIRIGPYQSFWKVDISSSSLGAVLYVNALTAQVWWAELTFYEDLPEELPYWKLKDVIEFCGLEPYYKGAVRNEEETEAAWNVKDSRLYAWMDIKEDAIARTNVQLNMGLAIREEDKE